MRTSNPPFRLLAPVLAGFFIVGFCDLVAPVSARIAAECTTGGQRTAVHFLPSMVFLWFLLLATPVAALMRRTGRKRIAMAGYALTFAGLAIPFLAGGGLLRYFVGFGLLGIGNTVLQVAVNPMLACLAPPERMGGLLTVGQIFRNCSLLLVAPLVTLAAARFGSWNLLLPLYAALTAVGALWMQLTEIPEAPADDASVARSAADCFRLLRLRPVRIGTCGVALFIMADVANGFLAARLIDDPSSLLTTTGYYACRIVGTIVGAGALQRLSERRYLRWNLAAALLLAAGLLFVRDTAAIYLLVGGMGFAFAGLFPAFYAVATKGAGAQADGAAGLLVMAISAGALSGPVCGALIRAAGDPHAGMLFAGCCLVAMLWLTGRLGDHTDDACGERPRACPEHRKPKTK